MIRIALSPLTWPASSKDALAIANSQYAAETQIVGIWALVETAWRTIAAPTSHQAVLTVAEQSAAEAVDGNRACNVPSLVSTVSRVTRLCSIEMEHFT